MSLQQIPGLYVAETEKKGRGMFCANGIKEGELIEICPLIKIPKDQVASIDKTILYNYYFLLNDKENPACIALGYGSLYNHTKNPNAEILIDADASSRSSEDVGPEEACSFDENAERLARAADNLRPCSSNDKDVPLKTAE